MKNIGEDAIVEEVFIEASPDRVFHALTEPEELLAWWGDPEQYTMTAWTLDLRVGGRWRAEGEGRGGARFVVEGEFVEIEPPHVLAFTWRPSWVDAPTTRVRITLDPRNGGTWVTWTHSGFLGYRKAMDDHRGGLPSVVSWLKAFVEKGE